MEIDARQLEKGKRTVIRRDALFQCSNERKGKKKTGNT